MTSSSKRDKIDVTEMGMRFEKFSEIGLHFFFGYGVMIAVFQAYGIFPGEMDLLKIKVTIGGDFNGRHIP